MTEQIDRRRHTCPLIAGAAAYAPPHMRISVDATTGSVENLKRVITRDSWDRQELRVERNVKRILDLMAEHGAHGTWFVLGWVAERLPALVRAIAAAGHEIGSNGFGHERVDTLSAEQFRADVRRSKALS